MKHIEMPITRSGEAMGKGVSEVAERIDRTIVYMTENLDRPLQVAALAARASVSPSHFFALFKRQTGSAPIDYFIRLRMERACYLLETTTTSVKEVAALLGYNDPFYFSRLFKSVNQLAPSEYRQRQRNTNGGAQPSGDVGDGRQNEMGLKLETRAKFGAAGAVPNSGRKYQFA